MVRCGQYPAWLDKNKSTLPEEEWGQRKEQYGILCRVCELYEKQQNPQDGLQEIVVLIEKMGQAPQELIDESAAAAATTQDGAQAPGMPAECPIM